MNQFFKPNKKNFCVLGLIGLKDRYVYTRSNKLRLRYTATAASCVLAGLVMLGVQKQQNNQTEFVPFETAENTDYESNFQIFLSDAIKSRISDTMRSAPGIIKKAETQIVEEKVPHRKVSIGSGQTIAGVLQDTGLSGSEAFYAVKAISEHFDPRKVRSGQELDVHFKELNDGTMGFERLEMKISPIKEILVTKLGDEDFSSELQEQELHRKVYGRVAEIQTSLYGSAARADIPSQITAEMIKIYSWGVDFQRDVRRGDKVEVLYEAFETEDGDFAKYGKILYANINKDGRENPIYRYEMDNCLLYTSPSPRDA